MCGGFEGAVGFEREQRIIVNAFHKVISDLPTSGSVALNSPTMVPIGWFSLRLVGQELRSMGAEFLGFMATENQSQRH